MLYEVPYEVFFFCQKQVYRYVKKTVCNFPGYMSVPNHGENLESVQRHIVETRDHSYRRTSEFVFIHYPTASQSPTKKIQSEIHEFKHLIEEIYALYDGEDIFRPAVVVWGERNDIIQKLFQQVDIDYITTSEFMDQQRITITILDIHKKLCDHRSMLSDEF